MVNWIKEMVKWDLEVRQITATTIRIQNSQSQNNNVGVGARPIWYAIIVAYFDRYIYM